MNIWNGSKTKCLISNIIVCVITVVLTSIIVNKCGHSITIDTSKIDSLQTIVDSLSNKKDSIDLRMDTVIVKIEKVKIKYEELTRTINTNSTDSNYKFFSEYIKKNSKRLDSISNN